MAVILEAAYSKKLGLPNYSSHSYIVSIRTELSDLSQVEEESSRLYSLLQQSVDNEIQQVGFLPDATRYGMENAETNGSARRDQHDDHAHRSNGHGENNGHTHGECPPDPAQDAWTCSDKQKEFILKLVSQHHIDKKEVEALAQQMFSQSVKALNRLQASGLIEELLERYGKAKRNGRGNGASYRRGARV